MKQRKYMTVMVIKDDMAELRQFRVPLGVIKSLIWGFALAVVLTATTGVLWVRKHLHQINFEAISAENQELKLANERYLTATLEIEEKLRYFDQKTEKLATLVGVETQSSQIGGLGGADYFENELSQYLRYDLSLIEHQSELIEQRLDTLDKAFNTHKELLDTTPSLLPSRGWLTSGYAYRKDPFTGRRTFHPGIDISCPTGTLVNAPANGVVIYTGYRSGFGYLLEIDHGNQIKTRYGHLSRFNVSKGQRVRRGDLIAYVGNSGRSTGPHLHFEIRKDGKTVNPMKYIIEDVRPF